MIHFKLAELATELELLRSGLYQATDLYVSGKDVTNLASMLKFKAGRLSRLIPGNAPSENLCYIFAEVG